MPRLRRALVVGCALVLFGSVTTATPAVSTEADEASSAHASPWADAAAEARVLAQRILQREGNSLLLDGSRLRALGQEIKQALSLIRRAYPAMADVPVREKYERATLLIELEGELRDAVFSTWDDGGTSAPPPTGYAAFDVLNAEVGLKGVRLFPSYDVVVLHLDERANIFAAWWRYLVIDGVASSGPDMRIGDGPDVDAAKVRDTWHFVFRNAWGDCPSGCIHEELSFFTVADGEVARIEPAQARAMEPFATLLTH